MFNGPAHRFVVNGVDDDHAANHLHWRFFVGSDFVGRTDFRAHFFFLDFIDDFFGFFLIGLDDVLEFTHAPHLQMASIVHATAFDFVAVTVFVLLHFVLLHFVLLLILLLQLLLLLLKHVVLDLKRCLYKSISKRKSIFFIFTDFCIHIRIGKSLFVGLRSSEGFMNAPSLRKNVGFLIVMVFSFRLIGWWIGWTSPAFLHTFHTFGFVQIQRPHLPDGHAFR